MCQHGVHNGLSLTRMEIVDARFARIGCEPPAQQSDRGGRKTVRKDRCVAHPGTALQFDQQFARTVIQRGVHRRRMRAHAYAAFAYVALCPAMTGTVSARLRACLISMCTRLY